MMNPIRDKVNGQIPFGQFGNMQNIIGQFNQFRQNFHGNPQQMVQNLLNTGRMSQEQFNQLSNIATQFQRMLGGN